VIRRCSLEERNLSRSVEERYGMKVLEVATIEEAYQLFIC